MLKYGKNIKFDPEKLHPYNIDRQSVNLVPTGSKVLEIGCATGFMGEYLIKKKKCIVTGVEMRLEEAKIAQAKLSQVVVGNIEYPEIQKKIDKDFDVVLASALVQHLVTPQDSLRVWKKFLKKDGVLIITCSNIVHWTTRLQILRGKFEYQEYGLLDNTHLKFFTPQTFKALVESADYIIEHFSIDAVGGGKPKISRFLSHFFPGLFTYQMVIKARKA